MVVFNTEAMPEAKNEDYTLVYLLLKYSNAFSYDKNIVMDPRAVENIAYLKPLKNVLYPSF